MKRLIDLGDKEARKELGDYYIISKVQMDNIINCFDNGVGRMKQLTDQIHNQQVEIGRLVKQLMEVSDD